MYRRLSPCFLAQRLCSTGDIGLIGLAVMVSRYLSIRIPSLTILLCLQGQNLILNMNDKGFTVVAYNRTTSKVDAFLANEAKGEPCLMIGLDQCLIILEFRNQDSGCTFHRGTCC